VTEPGEEVAEVGWVGWRGRELVDNGQEVVKGADGPEGRGSVGVGGSARGGEERGRTDELDGQTAIEEMSGEDAVGQMGQMGDKWGRSFGLRLSPRGVELDVESGDPRCPGSTVSGERPTERASNDRTPGFCRAFPVRKKTLIRALFREMIAT
jgi:hypothetical protein